jgi:putative SOS response-associated peptidase YedK
MDDAEMCGRFVQTSSPQRLAERFAAVDTITSEHRPRYNVAPSTPIPAVIDAGQRRLGLLRWGFVPPWAKDPDEGPRPINARLEGLATSRLFGPALARQRCIVPVDAWYEWTDEDGARQPWSLRPVEEGPVALAALWSIHRAADAPVDAPPLATVALITTEAQGAAASVHHRMPLTVGDDLLDAWLDRSCPADGSLLSALSATAPDVEVVRVSRRVNDVRNEGAELLEPAP